MRPHVCCAVPRGVLQHGYFLGRASPENAALHGSALVHRLLQPGPTDPGSGGPRAQTMEPQVANSRNSHRGRLHLCAQRKNTQSGEPLQTRHHHTCTPDVTKILRPSARVCVRNAKTQSGEPLQTQTPSHVHTRCDKDFGHTSPSVYATRRHSPASRCRHRHHHTCTRDVTGNLATCVMWWNFLQAPCPKHTCVTENTAEIYAHTRIYQQFMGFCMFTLDLTGHGWLLRDNTFCSPWCRLVN